MSAATAQIQAEIERLSGLVEATRRLVADGHLVDMRTLESRIDEVCGALRTLPNAAAGEIKTALVALIDDLNRLDQAIRRSHAEAAEHLEGPAARRRATAAYGAPDAKPERR